MTQLTPPPTRLAWTVWGLGAVLYFIGFYQRVAPAVMTAELMNTFQINAAALGTLSAFYFYSYVAMQVPTGILADTWGPRRLLAAGALVCGVGTLLFALAPGVGWANLGRLLIGGSVAVAFVGMLKLATHWFAPRQFALSAGLALFVGVIGAALAGVPLQALVAGFGWRVVMLASAALPLATGAAIWWIVRDDPLERGYTSYAHNPAASTSARPGFMAGLAEIFRYRNTWLLCLIPGGIVGATWRVNERFIIGGGAGIVSQIEDDIRVFPIIIIEWKLAEQWRISSQGPASGRANTPARAACSRRSWTAPTPRRAITSASNATGSRWQGASWLHCRAPRRIRESRARPCR